MRAVIDASALVNSVLAGAPRRLDFELAGDVVTELHVPALCDLELTSAIRRLLRQQRITLRDASSALDDYLDLPLTRHPHDRLLRRILALRDNLTAYDAAYVALAEALDATLVTADGGLAAAARAASTIEVLDIRM